MESSNVSTISVMSDASSRSEERLDEEDDQLADEDPQAVLDRERTRNINVHQFYPDIQPSFPPPKGLIRRETESDRPDSALTDVTLDEDDTSPRDDDARRHGPRQQSRDTTRTLGLSSGLTMISDAPSDPLPETSNLTVSQLPDKERTDISARVRFESDSRTAALSEREVSELTTITLSATDSFSLPHTPKKEDTQGDDSTGVFSTAVDEESLKPGRRAPLRSEATQSSVLFEPEKWQQAASAADKGPALTEIVHGRAHEHYLRGLQLIEQNDLSSAICALTKALALKPDTTEYFVQRAECYLLQCDFQSAILNYKKACVLEPDCDEFYTRLAFIYFFQGQTLFDQKLFPEALECFSRAAEMRPEHIGYQTRSVACLAALQRHGECLALVNKRLEDEKESADLYVMRARLHEMFRNTTLCYYDVRDALDLDPDHSEAKEMLAGLEKQADNYKDQAVRLALTSRHREALQKISAAIETNPTVEEFHNLRGSLHRKLNDFNAAIDDFLLAMDKCQQNEDAPAFKEAQRQLLLCYNDFAVECFQKGFYEEAIILLNRAIKSEKDERGLYINRGDCFYRLGNRTFALQDYHQALEMEAHDDGVRARVALIHNDYGTEAYEDKNFEEAESRFTLAIQHCAKVPQYYVSRARARFMMEKLDGSREDALMTLCLDPSNTELASLMTRLFPGKTINDVMESAMGRDIRKRAKNLMTTAGGAKLKPLSRTTSAGTSLTSRSGTEYTQSSSAESLRTRSATVLSEPDSITPTLNDHELQIQVVKEKQKIAHKLKQHYSATAQKTLNYGGPRVQPLPDAVSFQRRGGNPLKAGEGQPSKRTSSKKSSTNWKTFSRGIGITN